MAFSRWFAPPRPALKQDLVLGMCAFVRAMARGEKAIPRRTIPPDAYPPIERMRKGF